MQTSDTPLFEASVLINPSIQAVWNAWGALELPDCWLVAGCLAQTVWNERFGLPVDYGISDLDLVYFDPSDLSEQTEQRHAQRIRHIFAELPVRIDVKNQARVHLWYEAKFGFPIPPYQSVLDAIGTFPTTATTVGLRPTGHGTELCATYGLSDLFDGVVRANKRLITREIFEAKVAKWYSRWPDLKVIPWDER